MPEDMKTTSHYLSIATALALGSVLLVRAASAPIPASGKTALSRYLASAVQRGDVPGIVALVVDRDGVLYQGAAGKQDVARRVDMTPSTIFRIASMTKPVTSVAAMMLVEAGMLKLDDPVSKYLPEFERPKVLTTFDAASGKYETRDAKRPMTIRHLMTHTSGLGYSWSSPVVSRLTNNDRSKETQVPLLADPGEKWTYSASTRVLGQVVEKVSGQPLDVHLRQRIFAPLNMRDTAYAVSADKLPRVVTIHQRQNGKLTEQPNAPKQESPVSGEGGLYSTAADYGIFLRMLLNGGRLNGITLLRPETVTLMASNQIGSVVVEQQPDADPLRTRPFPLGAGRDKFGLGFQIAVRDERYTRYRSPGSLSWAGINNTHFWLDPQKQIGAVVLMQVLPFYDDTAIKVLRGFEELVYRNLE
jgi:CubicO group peptidase (beta-lactamase class C family)